MLHQVPWVIQTSGSPLPVLFLDRPVYSCGVCIFKEVSWGIFTVSSTEQPPGCPGPWWTPQGQEAPPFPFPFPEKGRSPDCFWGTEPYLAIRNVPAGHLGRDEMQSFLELSVLTPERCIWKSFQVAAWRFSLEMTDAAVRIASSWWRVALPTDHCVREVWGR